MKSLFVSLAAGLAAFSPQPSAGQDWRHWGGDLGGRRFADAPQLTPERVRGLTEAWRFRTGDATDGDEYFGRASTFKATPILVDDKLVLSSPFNRVFALDPTTGEQVWRFDPQVDFSIKYAEMFTARGVAAHTDPAAAGAPCGTRIFLGTLDARLIALDAATGERCDAFGDGGEIDLAKGVGRVRRGEYSVTSPPTVVGDVVVVGSSIGDNGLAKLEDGTVRAFDVRTGAMKWRFNPVPRSPDDPGAETWVDESFEKSGAGNVWSVMAADAARDLVFLPTTSPSPDFFGGLRPGNNAPANSLVALRASTGELVWSYQIVRHDLWDYDLAAQPVLADIAIDGAVRPVIAQATKTGFVFVLDRETGAPIHAVEERAAPASDVPGEKAAPSQPVPTIRLHEIGPDLPPIYAANDEHVAQCEAMLDGARYEGIFTPPSLDGTIVYPGNPGGVNWGSMAMDDAAGVALVAVNRLPTLVKLIPRRDFRRLKRDGRLNGVDARYTAQRGAPFGMARFELFNDASGFHCFEGPWSTLVAVDLATGETVWEAPLGRNPRLAEDDPAAAWGYFANGGPALSSGGVAFVATQYDRMLRGFDASDGSVIWSAELPAGPQATPMIFERDGDAYVVITAGGATEDGGPGDYVVGFRLPQGAD
ncbi:MAG: PQQ-binding-like beta-propeller repeat protein [Pseudomonadota bacterium]